MFGADALIPEGPLRLAALTGAPIVPVFAGRLGHRRYEVFASAPIHVDRGAGDPELAAAAQELARRLEAFVLPRPTQWFHFRND
jgi:KDO2-lipid IV(A) lauroyltransferase